MTRVPWRLGTALAVSGVVAGLVAAGLTTLLHLVQHLAFGYERGTFADGVAAAAGWRRVAALSACGVVAGAGWYALRRWLPAPVRVRVAVRERRRMRSTSTLLESVLQIVVVGLGASLGRESAPRRASGAFAQWVADGTGLDREQTRLVVACATGAGFGAVYLVPVAGTLFVAEVLLRTRAARSVLVAACVALLATAVATFVVPFEPFYRVAVDPGPTAWLLLAALLAGPVAAAAGRGFAAVTGWAAAHRPTGWRLPAAAVPVFVGLGLVGVVAPELLGNGRGPASLAFDPLSQPVWVLLLLAVAKPVVTAACLRGGATGGLVTPALATGALLGAALGVGWTGLVGGDVGSVAVLVAAGVLVVTMRAPFTAVAFAWEVTGVPVWFLLPLAVAAAGAWTCSRGWARPPV